MEYYIEHLSRIDEFCLEFKKLMLKRHLVFKFNSRLVPSYLRKQVISSPFYQHYLNPLKGLVQIVDAFGIPYLALNKEYLQSYVSSLENEDVIGKRSGFEESINPIIKFFSSDTMKTIKDKISLLKPEEIIRLDEAIHCFFQNCNYASVVMSVSAVESRLLLLMNSLCPNSKTRYGKLIKESSLGQLVGEYLDNEEKYNNIVPPRHRTLLQHCNNIRIFSAHPKKEIIDKSDATSILYMAFRFLLDENVSILNVNLPK